MSPELTLEFEVYCQCGEGLCGLTTTSPSVSRYQRGPYITVEPCPKCMDAADDAGYDRGYREAEAQAEATA